MCCVRSSANVSYENAAKDVEFFTGISVSGKTQQRLVHRQDFSAPQIETTVDELRQFWILDFRLKEFNPKSKI